MEREMRAGQRLGSVASACHLEPSDVLRPFTSNYDHAADVYRRYRDHVARLDQVTTPSHVPAGGDSARDRVKAYFTPLLKDSINETTKSQLQVNEADELTSRHLALHPIAWRRVLTSIQGSCFDTPENQLLTEAIAWLIRQPHIPEGWAEQKIEHASSLYPAGSPLSSTLVKRTDYEQQLNTLWGEVLVDDRSPEEQRHMNERSFWGYDK